MRTDSSPVAMLMVLCALLLVDRVAGSREKCSPTHFADPAAPCCPCEGWKGTLCVWKSRPFRSAPGSNSIVYGNQHTQYKGVETSPQPSAFARFKKSSPEKRGSRTGKTFGAKKGAFGCFLLRIMAFSWDSNTPFSLCVHISTKQSRRNQSQKKPLRSQTRSHSRYTHSLSENTMQLFLVCETNGGYPTLCGMLCIRLGPRVGGQ